MLSVFPNLLDFQFFGPFILRIVLGMILIVSSLDLVESKKIFAKLFGEARKKIADIFAWVFCGLKAVSGILIFAGLFTQPAAIGAMLVLGFYLVVSPYAEMPGQSRKVLHLVLFAIALSLLLTGPGAMAFDMPL